MVGKPSIVLLVALLFSNGQSFADNVRSKVDEQRFDSSDIDQAIAYSIGADIGANVVQKSPNMDLNAFLIGFLDGAQNRAPRLTAEQTRQALEEFKKRMAVQQPSYWSIGSTRDEVVAAQGTPTGVTIYKGLGQEVLKYGYSSVTIDMSTGRVVEYSNISNNLLVR